MGLKSEIVSLSQREEQASYYFYQFPIKHVLKRKKKKRKKQDGLIVSVGRCSACMCVCVCVCVCDVCVCVCVVGVSVVYLCVCAQCPGVLGKRKSWSWILGLQRAPRTSLVTHFF